MPVKQDGNLTAATLKARQVPDSDRVDAPGALARFIGTGDLAGWDTLCRVLEVVDSFGHGVNDAVDTYVSVIIQPQHLDGADDRVDTGPQLKVGYGEGYFIDIVGVVPAALPTSEHVEGARGLDHLTQAFMADIPQADQSGIAPGQPALAALAGAGEHGDPLPEQEKAQRARAAEFQRVFAAELSKTPEDIGGAKQRAEQATGLKAEPAAATEQPATPPDDLAEVHQRIFQAELEATPDQPDRALRAANDATGLDVKLADIQQEPKRQDV